MLELDLPLALALVSGGLLLSFLLTLAIESRSSTWKLRRLKQRPNTQKDTESQPTNALADAKELERAADRVEGSVFLFDTRSI